jgi:hypothetical protein
MSFPEYKLQLMVQIIMKELLFNLLVSIGFLVVEIIVQIPHELQVGLIYTDVS